MHVVEFVIKEYLDWMCSRIAIITFGGKQYSFVSCVEAKDPVKMFGRLQRIFQVLQIQSTPLSKSSDYLISCEWTMDVVCRETTIPVNCAPDFVTELVGCGDIQRTPRSAHYSVSTVPVAGSYQSQSLSIPMYGDLGLKLVGSRSTHWTSV